MSTTCIEAESEAMISPMASAMRPETPVSISSKMIVGSCIRSASRAFRASITRESSPPEAMRSTGCGVIRGLAVKRNCTLSRPVRPGSARGVRAMRKTVSGMPSRARVERMCFSNPAAAFSRVLCRRSASVAVFSAASERAASAWAISSSLWTMAASCAAQRSRRAISSASSAARCFCCRAISVSSRAEHFASRSGSASSRSHAAAAEPLMSFSSSSTERSRPAYSPAAG